MSGEGGRVSCGRWREGGAGAQARGRFRIAAIEKSRYPGDWRAHASAVGAVAGGGAADTQYSRRDGGRALARGREWSGARSLAAGRCLGPSADFRIQTRAGARAREARARDVGVEAQEEAGAARGIRLSGRGRWSGRQARRMAIATMSIFSTRIVGRPAREPGGRGRRARRSEESTS